jgi:hypothetical protein
MTPKARGGRRSTPRQTPGTLYINKLAAASRQLDAAIRIFFIEEDELAIHTIASAALRILRDLLKKRGRNLAIKILQAGIYNMAWQYAEGTLPKEVLRNIENTVLMDVIRKILEIEAAQGSRFDYTGIRVTAEATFEQRMFPSHAANFLKHADRDPKAHLAVGDIKNEKVLSGACAAYLDLMSTASLEVMTFIGFWAVKNDVDLGGVPGELAQQLRSVEEPARRHFCADFIRTSRRQ